MYKTLILPAAFLAAMIIGAGVFALPFIFLKAGLPAGAFYLLFFGFVFAVIHIFYAEVILGTAGERHRFVKYAEIYLGKNGFWVSVFTTAIGLVLTLTIYIVLSASFFNLIFPELESLYAIFIFWFVSSIFIFLKLEKLAYSEFLVTFAMLVIILFIFMFGLFFGEAQIEYSKIDFSYFLLPFGPVLFALAGRPAISSIIDYFDRNNIPAEGIKKAIWFGTFVPALVYFLFAVGILKISPAVAEDAVSGLVFYIPHFFLAIIGIFGLFSLWSSYTIIAREIKGIFELDFNLPYLIALVGVIFLPLIFYFAGLRNFLVLVSAAGGIFLAAESILVVLMRRAMSRRSVSPFFTAIILIFIGGILYEIMKLL